MLFGTYAADYCTFSPAAICMIGFIMVAITCRLSPCIACWLTSFFSARRACPPCFGKGCSILLHALVALAGALSCRIGIAAYQERHGDEHDYSCISTALS